MVRQTLRWCTVCSASCEEDHSKSDEHFRSLHELLTDAAKYGRLEKESLPLKSDEDICKAVLASLRKHFTDGVELTGSLAKGTALRDAYDMDVAVDMSTVSCGPESSITRREIIKKLWNKLEQAQGSIVPTRAEGFLVKVDVLCCPSFHCLASGQTTSSCSECCCGSSGGASALFCQECDFAICTSCVARRHHRYNHNFRLGDIVSPSWHNDSFLQKQSGPLLSMRDGSSEGQAVVALLGIGNKSVSPKDLELISADWKIGDKVVVKTDHTVVDAALMTLKKTDGLVSVALRKGDSFILRTAAIGWRKNKATHLKQAHSGHVRDLNAAGDCLVSLDGIPTTLWIRRPELPKLRASLSDINIGSADLACGWKATIADVQIVELASSWQVTWSRGTAWRRSPKWEDYAPNGADDLDSRQFVAHLSNGKCKFVSEAWIQDHETGLWLPRVIPDHLGKNGGRQLVEVTHPEKKQKIVDLEFEDGYHAWFPARGALDRSPDIASPGFVKVGQRVRAINNIYSRRRTVWLGESGSVLDVWDSKFGMGATVRFGSREVYAGPQDVAPIVNYLSVDILPSGIGGDTGSSGTHYRGDIALQHVAFFSDFEPWQRNLVRLLKAWFRTQSNVPGIILEYAVKRIANPKRSSMVENIQLGFIHVMKELLNGWSSWTDPVCDKRKLCGSMTELDKILFNQTCTSTLQALQQLGTGRILNVAIGVPVLGKPCCDWASLNKAEEIAFASNKRLLDASMRAFASLPQYREVSGPANDDIVKWVAGFRPVHRCSLMVFEHILGDGGLRSKASQAHLREQPEATAIRLRLKSDIASLGWRWWVPNSHYNVLHRYALRFILHQLEKDVDKQAHLERSVIEQKGELIKVFSESIQSAKARHRNRIGTPEEAIESFNKTISEKVEFHRSAARTGKNCNMDLKLGTHRHVFSIMGPHTDQRYGDIVIILKPKVAQHPDFNMTFSAATSYCSRRAFWHHPWAATLANPDLVEAISRVECSSDSRLSSLPLSPEEGIDLFHRSKLHPHITQWQDTLANDMVRTARLECAGTFSSKRCQTCQCNLCKRFRKVYKDCGVSSVEDVSTEVVKKWYTTIDSHGCIEAHLPGFVPLEFIEHIILPASMLSNKLENVLKGWETSEGMLFDRVIALDIPISGYRSAVLKWQEDYFSRCSLAASPTPGIPIANAFAFSLPEPGLESTPCWLPEVLSECGRGSVVFSVMGQHVRIMMASEPTSTPSEVFLAVIGALKNTITYLKNDLRRRRGELAKTTHQQNARAMASLTTFETYWFRVDRALGSVALGRGAEVGQNVLLSAQGVAKNSRVRYVGVSHWSSPVCFDWLSIQP